MFRQGLGMGGRKKPRSKEQRWGWGERPGGDMMELVNGAALARKPDWTTSSLGLPCQCIRVTC